MNRSAPNILDQSQTLMRELLEVVQRRTRDGEANGEVAYNAVNNLLAALAVDMGVDRAFATKNLGEAYAHVAAAARKKA